MRHDNYSSSETIAQRRSPACRFHFVSHSCRWAVDEGQCHEVDASLAGLAVAVAGPGVPPAASLLLAPQDWDVHVARNSAAGSVAVLLGVGSVTACLSVAAAEALSDLAAALTPGGGGGSSSIETPAQSTGGSAASGDPPGGSPQQQFSGQHTDDLACGLFSLSPELAGRPGQIPLPPSFVPTSDAVCPLHPLKMSIERRPGSSSFRRCICSLVTSRQ